MARDRLAYDGAIRVPIAEPCVGRSAVHSAKQSGLKFRNI